MVVLEKDKIEYQEANALYINYSSVSWIAASIFFTAAFAILGLTWEVEEPTLLILFAVTSIVLCLFGLLIEKRCHFYCDTIIKRIWKLEEKMGLNLHLLIKEKDKEATLKSPFLHSIERIRNLRYLILVALVLFWVLRIVLSCFF